MMKKFKLLLASITTTLLLLAPATVHAVDPLENIDCSGTAATSSVCLEKKNNPDANPVAGKDGILTRVTGFIAIVAGVIAVIMIIVAGIRFTTSHGDPQGVAGARNTLLFAVIGLIVIVVAQSIVVFVVNNI